MNEGEFEKHVRETLIPKVDGSRIFVAIHTGSIDAKFAVEIGLAILMDKPILACVTPGVKVPGKLAAVVDRFVEFDLTDAKTKAESQRRLEEAILELVPEIKRKAGES